MTKIKYKEISSNNIGDESVKELIKIIKKSDNQINLGLSGGSSILKTLESLKGLNQNYLSKLNFFLIDERIQRDYNSDLIHQNLFNELLKKGKISKKQIIFPDLTQKNNLKKLRRDYKKKIKKFGLDILIGGVGSDCHFGSIFPGSDIIHSDKLVELIYNSPKPPKKRLTITLNAINKDSKVILIFKGEKKKEALVNFKKNDFHNMYPCTFLKKFDTTIITDIKNET